MITTFTLQIKTLKHGVLKDINIKDDHELNPVF